jgi:maltose alpha-D-glucosyltransferase/alpha-amylase
MSDAQWWTKAVIYELYIDKFAGNLKGLTEKLDYFTYLGVNTLWLLPHYPSPGIDGGYDISDYQNIRSDLGTLDDFDRFLQSAHEHGLKVIIDLVLNHTSNEHSWFKEARASKDSPKRDWYIWSDHKDRFTEAFVHFSEIKNNSNWVFNESTGDYYYATFYPEQPDLNWDNPELMSAMLEVIDYWLGKGVDGFRLDAVSRLIKRDGTNCFALPETHAVLKKIRSHIDSKFSGIVLIAETGGWPHEARTFFAAGDECQMVINFPLAVKLLSGIKNRDLEGVDKVWQWCGEIPAACRWAVFLTNHDSVDVFFLGSDEEKQEILQRADPTGQYTQPGGLSIGARLAEVCQGNQDDIIWATRQLLSQPGVPIIYYGNEIGMRNQSFPEKPPDTRICVRNQFDWAEADKQKSDPNSILNQVRNAIRNRTS